MAGIYFRPNGNTQVIAANSTSQTMTLPSCGAVMVHAFGNVSFVNISSNANVTATIANVTTSSASVPVEIGAPQFISTGQQFNNTPGPVYVAIVSGASGNVYVTPVEVL
jgi:hypothetical protein